MKGIDLMSDLLNLSKEQSLELLNLRKERVELLCLDKKPLQNLVSRVSVVLDYSISMENLYKKGIVQAVLEKLFPIALQFDDNGEMELWIFSDDFHRLPNITMDNYYGYIDREVIKYRMGCTQYAPPMKDIYQKYIHEDPANIPNYVIFITDGDNQDKDVTKQVITQISHAPIFWQFVGIGRASFSFLEQLDEMDGRYVDNANFFKIDNIYDANDDILYNQLLAEYPQWLEYPEVKQMIAAQGPHHKNLLEMDAQSGNMGKKKGFFGRLFG